MNIFVLDEDISTAAKYHVDKHVVKMITETAQLLSAAYYYTLQRELTPYRLSHYNHPGAKWARESLDNWEWLSVLGLYLYAEYKYRYGDRTHAAGEVIIDFIRTPPRLPRLGRTKHPLCMPDEYKTDNVVESYRAYYNGDKSHLFTWTGRPIPDWVVLPKGVVDWRKLQ